MNVTAHARSDSYELNDGARIAVIGGGPTGAFFSIFALKMAKMIDKQIEVSIFEPKDFRKCGPAGCNRCGGVISELLVQTLAIEGVHLPETVVQRGINGYQLHTVKGSVAIATPSHENTIATVYRGGGPLGLHGDGTESFDQFLLDLAVQEGAILRRERIDRVEQPDKRPCLFSRGEKLIEADLVVGAYGVNVAPPEWLGQTRFPFARPKTVTTAIAELACDPGSLETHFGQAIQLFLLPVPNVKFAAMIPKGTHVTVCMLGKNLDQHSVAAFLDHPVVSRVLPPPGNWELCCRCLPKMNVGAPRFGFGDRSVICGDTGSTRLFKDGLGAAYLMGKAAAVTAVFQGVGREHFAKYYQPVYQSIVTDNWFGRYLFAVTDLNKRYGVMTQAMLEVVRTEQARPNSSRALSSILWNMFTGNERYKNIFLQALSLPMHLEIWAAMARSLTRRNP